MKHLYYTLSGIIILFLHQNSYTQASVHVNNHLYYQDQGVHQPKAIQTAPLDMVLQAEHKAKYDETLQGIRQYHASKNIIENQKNQAFVEAQDIPVADSINSKSVDQPSLDDVSIFLEKNNSVDTHITPVSKITQDLQTIIRQTDIEQLNKLTPQLSTDFLLFSGGTIQDAQKILIQDSINLSSSKRIKKNLDALVTQNKILHRLNANDIDILENLQRQLDQKIKDKESTDSKNIDAVITPKNKAETLRSRIKDLKQDSADYWSSFEIFQYILNTLHILYVRGKLTKEIILRTIENGLAKSTNTTRQEIIDDMKKIIQTIPIQQLTTNINFVFDIAHTAYQKLIIHDPTTGLIETIHGIDKLKNYKNIIDSKGDGNCGYRAVLASLYFNSIHDKNIINHLQKLVEEHFDSLFTEFDPQKTQQNRGQLQDKTIQTLHNIQAANTIEEIKEIIDNNEEFDRTMIMFERYLMVKTMNKESNHHLQAFLYEDSEKIKPETFLQFGESLDQPSTALLAEALNIKITTEQKEPENPAQITLSKNPQAHAHILYIPGHYQILIPQAYAL